MFPKLFVLILAMGVTACVLLTLRQQRLDAVHELAVSQRNIAQRDRDLYDLRTRIAQRVLPQNVEALASAIAPLAPIRVEQPIEIPQTAVALSRTPSRGGDTPARGTKRAPERADR